jgi:hypothetical protein
VAATSSVVGVVRPFRPWLLERQFRRVTRGDGRVAEPGESQVFEQFRCMHPYSDTKGTQLRKGQVYSLREVRRSDDGQVWASVVEAGNIPLSAFTFCCQPHPAYDPALTVHAVPAIAAAELAVRRHN